MISAEVSVRVYSTVTGRTGNWSYRTVMRFEAAPRPDDHIIWGQVNHELTDRVRRVYHYDELVRPPGHPAIAIELEPVKTDSPDILTELMDLHSGWEQLGGPWAEQ